MISVPPDVRPVVKCIELETPYPIFAHFNRRNGVSGIYVIQNTCTDQCYVGASQCVAGRWVYHARSLRFDLRRATRLQQDFNANPDAFVFRLIEECSKEELGEHEAFWIDEYQSLMSEWGYNTQACGYSIKKKKEESLQRLRQIKGSFRGVVTKP